MVAPFFVAILEVKQMVKINGELFDVAGISVKEYLLDGGYDLMRVAVELNGIIIPKSQYQNTYLSDDDCVEVVSFVGGG